MPRRAEILLEAQDLDLLLHLALLELQVRHVLVVDLLRLGLLRGDGPDLPHERLARLRHGLGRELQALLRLGHQVRLDARGRHQLRRRGRHLVRRDDELLERVRAGEHAVRALDQQVRRERDRARRGDEALRPAVVPLVELLRRARPFALRDDLLLRVRRRADEPADRVRDRQRGREDRVVHLEVDRAEAARVARARHELLQARGRGLDRLRGAQHRLLDEVADVPVGLRQRGRLALRDDGLDGLRQFREGAAGLAVVAHRDRHALGAVDQVELVRLQVQEEPQADVSGRPRHVDELVGRVVALRQARDALDVDEGVREGLRELVGALDDIHVVATGLVVQVEVEDGGEIGRVRQRLFDHGQGVFGRRVLVAGLGRRLEFVDGVVHLLNAGLEDGV